MKVIKISLQKKKEIIETSRLENYKSSLALEGMELKGRFSVLSKKKDKKALIAKYRVA